MFMNKLLFCFVLKQDLKLKTYPKMTECPIPLLPLPEAGLQLCPSSPGRYGPGDETQGFVRVH